MTRHVQMVNKTFGFQISFIDNTAEVDWIQINPQNLT